MCGAQVCVEVLAGGKTQWGFALQVHCVFVTDEKQRSDIELEVPQRCLALLMRAAVEAHKLMDWSPAPGGSGWEGLSNGGGSQGGAGGIRYNCCGQGPPRQSGDSGPDCRLEPVTLSPQQMISCSLASSFPPAAAAHIPWRRWRSLLIGSWQ